VAADSAAAAVVAEAAAVAVAAAVVAAAVAVEDGDKHSMRRKPMKSKSANMNSMKLFLTIAMILVLGGVIFSLQAAPAAKDAAATATQQKQFNTPKEATDALVQAAESFDVNALKEILGPDSTDVVASEDQVADKDRAMAFAAKAKEKSDIVTDKKNPSRAILTVGNDDFPLPIPIVKQKGKWMFDIRSGAKKF
jgi:hypothetical protein